MKSISLLFLTALLLSGAAADYAGQQTRAIKALSDDEVSGYRAGRGQGLARPAELNGYPGPRHTLDLAAELHLSPEQVSVLTAEFERMRGAAIPLGEQLIAQEAALDQLFARREATPERVTTLTAEIGATQGALRSVHLRAHLATFAVLSSDQIAAYNRLRGYDAPTAAAPAGHDHHHHGSP